jgi:hypothetical protein
MFHWVPTTMNAQDTKEAQGILGSAETSGLAGGGEKDTEFTHVDAGGTVLGRVRSPSLRNAAVYFMNGAWDEPVTTQFVQAYIPLVVRNSVIDAVDGGFMCSCASAKCSDPGCDTRAFRWAREYLESYGSKSQGVPPPVVRVRGVDSRVHTFTPHLKPLEHPSLDEIRDGVVAKLSIQVV